MGATPWRFKSSPGHHLTGSLMNVWTFIFICQPKDWPQGMCIILERAENGTEEEQLLGYVDGAVALTIDFDQATRIREQI